MLKIFSHCCIHPVLLEVIQNFVLVSIMSGFNISICLLVVILTHEILRVTLEGIVLIAFTQIWKGRHNPLKHLRAYLSKLWLLRLLLPGGDVDLQMSQFSRAAKIFYNLALKVWVLICLTVYQDWQPWVFFYISKSLELSKDLGLKIMAIAFMYWYLVFIHSLVLQGNDAGDYFPIWGTCQGFQQLTVLTANKNLLTLTDTKAVALPLTLTSGFSVTFCYSIWLFCQVRYKLAYILSESFKLAYFYIFIPWKYTPLCDTNLYPSASGPI